MQSRPLDDPTLDPHVLLELCRRAEERATRLQEAYDRLKELDRLKTNFLATVSHELRTPLTSILGYSEMLLEGFAGDLRQEQADYVRTIHEKGDQLLSLILGILDLTKLESGTMPMRRTVVRVGNLLQEARSTLAPNALRKGIALNVEVSPELPDVQGDPDRLRQVFVNLGDNALKFTGAGGSVTLDARTASDGRIEVRVLDTGIGIAPRERGRVFDPFYQGDAARGHGGAGLGLSIVKRLVEAHGGTVGLDGNSPAGTSFSVMLPAVVR